MNQRRRGCQPNLRTRGRSTKDVPGDYPVGCSGGVKPSPCTSGQENPQRRGADQRARRRRNELRTARPAQPRVLDAPQEPVQLAPGVKWKQGQLHERWPQRHTTSYRDPHTRGATQPPGRKKSRTRANIFLEPKWLRTIAMLLPCYYNVIAMLAIAIHKPPRALRKLNTGMATGLCCFLFTGGRSNFLGAAAC